MHPPTSDQPSAQRPPLTPRPVSSGALALCNFIIFPRLAERRPIPTLFIASAALLSFVYAAPPLLPLVGHAALLPALLLHNAAAQGLTSTCFTAVFLLINDSCPVAARGRVNGLGMALSSAFKAVGPTLGAVSFAWSLNNGVGPPWDVHFTFLSCGLLSAICALAAARAFPLPLGPPREAAASCKLLPLVTGDAEEAGAGASGTKTNACGRGLAVCARQDSGAGARRISVRSSAPVHGSRTRTP